MSKSSVAKKLQICRDRLQMYWVRRTLIRGLGGSRQYSMQFAPWATPKPYAPLVSSRDIRSLTNLALGIDPSPSTSSAPQLTERSSASQCITCVLTEEETTRFLRRCNIYIRHITALVMQELYGDNSPEQANVFAMVYKGRRWLPAGVPAAPPTHHRLASAYIRVPHSGPPLPATSFASKEECMALRDTRVKRILDFAERYKEEFEGGQLPDSRRYFS